MSAAQLDLLPADPLAATGARMQSDGWIGHPGGHPSNGARFGSWTHPALPGVEVRHCGHPTALRPYWIAGAVVGEARTRKYSTLHAAKVAAFCHYERTAQ